MYIMITLKMCVFTYVHMHACAYARVREGIKECKGRIERELCGAQKVPFLQVRELSELYQLYTLVDA